MKVIELKGGHAAIMDDEDFTELAQYRWHINPQGYARRSQYMGGGRKNQKVRVILMHHMILPPKEGFHTDHRNGNRLDNRRCNLRYATYGQNCSNSALHKDSTTGFKGVTIDHRYPAKPFRARIRKDKKLHSLGYFKTAEEAHAVYCAAATERWGDFARFN